MRRIHTILIACYPLAAHFALLSSQQAWALWFLAAVSVSQFLVAYLSPTTSRWTLAVPVIVLSLCILGLLKGSLLALYLAPIFIQCGLLWLFASTLRKGREALITTFARVVFKESDPEVLRYTRRVTQVWSLFFIALLVETILLTLFAPLELWSLFANVLNYLFIVLLFVLELSYRRLRFPHRPQRENFFRQLASTNWAELLKANR